MQDQSISDYVSGGGKITICPEVLKKNRRGVNRELTNGYRSPPRQPRKVKDELCKTLKCQNIKSCKHACPMLAWIDGNSETVEKIIRCPETDHAEYRDYNKVLYDMAQKPGPIDIIMEIPDIRQRAIASMLNVGISKQQIAGLLKLTKRQISRICMSPPK
ncbi:MAG: hypothetical protein WC455_16365 [Dehalococcoidia bacterium]|jgi:hypothetical protein